MRWIEVSDNTKKNINYVSNFPYGEYPYPESYSSLSARYFSRHAMAALDYGCNPESINYTQGQINIPMQETYTYIKLAVKQLIDDGTAYAGFYTNFISYITSHDISGEDGQIVLGSAKEFKDILRHYFIQK